MKKKTTRITLLSTFFIFVFSACSSIDSDAKKAANLNMESIDYAFQNKLEEAKEAYQASQEVIAKYKDTPEYEEFYALYDKYLTEKISDN